MYPQFQPEQLSQDILRQLFGLELRMHISLQPEQLSQTIDDILRQLFGVRIEDTYLRRDQFLHV